MRRSDRRGLHWSQMPVKISRLRLWFAIGAICVAAIVSAAYFYARWRVENALKEVPGKMGIEFQQTAQGFTLSKSDGARTLFKIQAGKAVRYKIGGRLELHDVTITVYGSDSDRFDQLHGQDFVYDPNSGDATAQGKVRIDLEANPAGLTSPDQATPKQLKNPIHLQTSGLVFNQKTGNAHTEEPIAFQIPQGSGSAEGVDYVAKTGILTLQKNVNLDFTGERAAKVSAASATINKQSRTVMLNHPRIETDSERVQSGLATLFLRTNNSVERVLATGNVDIRMVGKDAGQAHAESLNILLWQDGQDVKQAILAGKVHMVSTEPEPFDGEAARVVLDFGARDRLKTVHSEGNVKLVEWQNRPKSGAADKYKAMGQKIELTAPAVDFVVAKGKLLQRAWTEGPSEITLPPREFPNKQIAGKNNNQNPQTVVTAGKFEGIFNSAGLLTSVHGAPNVRVVSSSPSKAGGHSNPGGQSTPDSAARVSEQVSTSDALDAILLPGKGIQSFVQQGHVVYKDDERQAWAGRGTYTPADQMLVLTGSPRVTQGSMTVTAQSMRLNHGTRDATAQGNVKTTYNQSKPQTGGALLGSSSPIHVTADNMTAHSSPGVAIYSGNARLWQDANMVQAPSIEFDQSKRQVVAQSTSGAPVSTTLAEVDSKGAVLPVTITCARLRYADEERKIHILGGTTAKGADVTLTANQMEISLLPVIHNAKTTPAATTSSVMPVGKIEKIVASGNVVAAQPGRKAIGEELIYIPADDKFVLTGNSPSIFDAEHGKITGVSLTFFRHDDRVLVEGSQGSPAVSRARVAR